MFKRMTNIYKKIDIRLILISDGHLYQHCRKNFNFQRTWGLQNIQLCHLSGCPVKAMSSLPLCSEPGKNYSFSTSDLWNPLPEHKGWETCGGSVHLLPQFSNCLQPLPVEHEAVSLWVCRMKKNGCYVAGFGQGKQLSKAVINSIPFPLKWKLHSLGINALIGGELNLLLNQSSLNPLSSCMPVYKSLV